MTILDWGIVAAYLVLSLLIGLYYTRRAGRNLESYFVSGRNMPWWLAGLSMVATTFAADTPLLVTELVRQNGIGGNWLWWNMLLGGMLTTFFFARMWRRSGVVTDLEFTTLRYAGRAANWLRGIRAAYMGLLINALVIGWVNLAMLTILRLLFPELSEQEQYLMLGALMLLTVGYAALSGLTGVIVTDAVQFGIAMVGCIILAVVVVNSDNVGGLDGLAARLHPDQLRFMPSLGNEGTAGGLALGFGVFLSMIALQWWASWYPGNEPGGGGYVAQRMLAARNERHALGATLLFQVFHYAVRPWPWILVGLATVVLYPTLPTDHYRDGFVLAMRDYLDPGLLGLLFVAFLAAYMSTLSTQLNWGLSYLVNDLVKPYLLPHAPEKRYVLIARIGTLVLMLLSFGITTVLSTIEQAWLLLINAGAGVGGVLILRWLWWRVNVWSEIAALLLPLGLYPLFVYLDPFLVKWVPALGVFADRLVYVLTVTFTTVGWLLVTVVTPPEPDAHLRAFVQRVRPLGWWARFRGPDDRPDTPALILLLCWALGLGAVYGALLGTGAVIFSRWDELVLFGGMATGCTLLLFAVVRRWKVFS
jgi:Na+/proline symporter